MLARALVLEPAAILLDEPTAGLDASIRARLLLELAAIREARGLAYVIISHDLAAVSSICDRIAVLYQGRVVEIGVSRAVLTAPGHPYTRQLLAATPRVGGPRVPDRAPSPIEIAEPRSHVGCRFRSRCSEAVPGCTEVDPLLAGDNDHQAACIRFAVKNR